MINRSIVLCEVEDRMHLYGLIDDACIDINEMQESYSFGSSDIFEKGLINYHYQQVRTPITRRAEMH